MKDISVKEKGLSFRELNFTVAVNISQPKVIHARILLNELFKAGKTLIALGTRRSGGFADFEFNVS